MTPERRRALLMMGGTFVIGIIIGSLAMGMVARQFYHGHGGSRNDIRPKMDGRRGSLTDKIFRTVKADSSQKLLMKPIIDQTMTRIDNLEEQSRTNAHVEMDSLKMKLRPILRTEQMDLLEEFLSFKGKPAGSTQHDRRH